MADVLARVQEIRALVERAASPAVPSPQPAAFGNALAASDASALATVLADPAAAPESYAGYEVGLQGPLALATAFYRPPALEPVAGAPAGERALAIAAAEVGVREEPPGSNEGARIADYRTATDGAYAGAPWCAYFVSWAAAQAGSPLGEEGQGYGAVEEIEAWGRRTGRFVEAGTRPEPGDLILFGGRHVGIVEAVDPDGAIRTVEGNYSQGVSRVRRSPAEATGFVRLG